MSVITKAAIRDAATAAIKAIAIPQPTATLASHPEIPFSEYPRSGSIRFLKTVPKARTFQVEIGRSKRLGLENLVEVDKQTTFRVIVVYPGQGDVTATENMIALDVRLVANALRDESNAVPLVTDEEAETKRIEVGGQLVYSVETEWRGQHTEAEWGAT